MTNLDVLCQSVHRAWADGALLLSLKKLTDYVRLEFLEKATWPKMMPYLNGCIQLQRPSYAALARNDKN